MLTPQQWDLSNKMSLFFDPEPRFFLEIIKEDCKDWLHLRIDARFWLPVFQSKPCNIYPNYKAKGVTASADVID